MKNSIKLLIGMAFCLTIGCEKDDDIEINCIDAKLEEVNMVAYDNQEIGCNSFLELYNYKNKQYFLLGNNCADIISYPIDCDGNKLCDEGQDSECDNFYKNSKRIGIVGITE